MKLLKNKIGSLVEIEWYDALGDTWSNEKVSLVKTMKIDKNCLVINTSYGELLRYEKDAVIIITEKSTSTNQEVTIIPTGWIKKVTILK
jgi:hypothetical protein